MPPSSKKKRTTSVRMPVYSSFKSSRTKQQKKMREQFTSSNNRDIMPASKHSKGPTFYREFDQETLSNIPVSDNVHTQLCQLEKIFQYSIDKISTPITKLNQSTLSARLQSDAQLKTLQEALERGENVKEEHDIHVKQNRELRSWNFQAKTIQNNVQSISSRMNMQLRKLQTQYELDTSRMIVSIIQAPKIDMQFSDIEGLPTSVHQETMSKKSSETLKQGAYKPPKSTKRSLLFQGKKETHTTTTSTTGMFDFPEQQTDETKTVQQ